MASKIFQQFDDTPSGVSRSVQPGLTRRNTLDTKYGLITPNFEQYLYPGESLTIEPTTFVKLPVPLNRPQLSRVRFVQRFYKIDLRTMWLGWEEYIKGTDTQIDSGGDLEVPYIVNAYKDGTTPNRFTGKSISIAGQVDQTIGNISEVNSFSDTVEIPRQFELDSDGFPGSSNASCAVFGIHELGDYLDCAIAQTYSAKTMDNPGMLYRHAFDFAAYQLIYSYGFRNPRVQRRVDDYYQMFNQSGNQIEFPTFVQKSGITGAKVKVKGHMEAFGKLVIDSFGTTNPGTQSNTPIIDSVRQNGIIYPSGYTPVDKALSTDADDINRSSWENIEHFPLKAGANSSLLAFSLDSNGFPKFRTSSISLSRMRYANWTSDRFITATLSPQEGDEAQIPVNGTISVNLPDSTTVTFENLSFTIPERSAKADSIVASSDVFAGNGSNVSISTNNLGSATVSSAANLTNALLYTDALFDASQVTMPEYNGTISGSGSATLGGTASALSQLYVSPSDFRFYMQMQKIKEMQQQTDNRYKSFMTKFFGSRVPDSQLDRPQYLGGYVQDLNVTTVNQTSDGTNPLGSQAGQITDAKSGYKIRVHADQHCLIMGVCFIMPDTEYVGGQNREFVARDRFDWMLPQFGNISKQAIYNYELAYNLTDTDDTLNPSPFGVFGYEPVYNYLRWTDNRCVGAFRDFANSTGCYEEFKPWIVKRNYGQEVLISKLIINNDQSLSMVMDYQNVVPTLSDEFLSMRYGVDDSNFSVSNELMYPFMVDSYFKVRSVRKIPTLGIPRV